MEKKVILLVEDNPDDELLTRRALSTNNVGNEVVVVRDGQAAIDYLIEGERRELPAVVLLDLNLPKVSGLEVLRRIREDDYTKFLPVVILTSSKEEQDLIGGYRLGCNSYVRKPVNFDEFVQAAKHLGLYWLLLNEQPPRAPAGNR